MMRILIFLSLLLSSVSYAQINITVSIKPIHSIVSYLTQNAVKPQLLFQQNQLVHHSHLKPSHLNKIYNSDLLIVISDDFEFGLKKILANIKPEKKLIVADIKGIKLLQKCEKSLCKTNYHLWLNLDNMQIFAQKLVQKLSQIDKKNQPIYAHNLRQFTQQLKQKKNTHKQTFSALNTVPLTLFSNAFEYFTNANKLTTAGIITNFHGEKLSLAKILKSRKMMQQKKTHCLLHSAEIPKKKIKILLENLPIKSSKIDILGFDIKSGANHYFALMRLINTKIAQCLQ